MSQTSKDEIDLGYLINKISELFKNISVSIYNSIQFCLRNWYFIVGLLIGGIVLGYFSEIDSKPAKKATLILRTNFNTAEYTYNSLQVLLDKSKSKDSAFLSQNGFKTGVIEIIGIEPTPMINFREISKKFEPNDRVLETLLRNVEFKDDEAVSESFFSDYKYHEVFLSLSSEATEQTIDKILAYLNNNNYIKDIAKNGLKSLEETISENTFTIRQIDSTLANYYKNNSISSSNNQLFVVDKNFSFDRIIFEKNALLENNTLLKQDLIYANNAVVKINNANIIEEVTPIFFKKFVVYPVLFIVLFLIPVWLRKKYQRIKKLALSK
jgi:hypothetical protein